MRRIAHFVSAFPVLSETFVLDEIEAFARRGFENVVVCLRSGPKGKTPLETSEETRSRLGIVRIFNPLFSLSAPLRTFALSPGGSLSTSFTLLMAGLGYPHELPKMLMTAWRMLEIAPALNDLGVIHCHAHFAHYPASLAWGCSRVLGATFSFNAHSYDLERYRAHLSTKVRDADRMFPISDHNREILKRAGSHQPEVEARIETIRCGIQLDHYPPRIPQEPKRSPANRGVILGVGRLVDTKGFADLVEAAALLKQEGLRFEVRIVGEGPERGRLESLIERKGLTEHVFLLGSLSREATRDEQRRADIVTQPCRSGRDGLDGIPVVLMEAMALGVPVISTRFAAIPELIEDGSNGHLVEPGRPDCLARTLSTLLRSPETGENLAARGRETIERDYLASQNYSRKCDSIAGLLDRC